MNDTKIVDNSNHIEDDDVVPPDNYVAEDLEDAPAHTFKVNDPDHKNLRPLFGWQDAKTIKKTFKKIFKKTFKNTTQYTRMPHGTILKKHYKSPFPALNVKRLLDEPVATDAVYSDTPAIASGETYAQIFVGTETLVLDIYGM